MSLSALALALAVVAEGPTHQELVFANARAALSEASHAEVLELWLLRNALAQRGEPGPHDADFVSLVWIALGELGMCGDGFPRDDGSSGVWPLTVFNWAVRTMSMPDPMESPAPFDAFRVGRQQRLVSLHDVLDLQELRTVVFKRTRCRQPKGLPLVDRQTFKWDRRDRLEVAKSLRALLLTARSTVRRDKVKNALAIDARLFDLELAITGLTQRAARREAMKTSSQARTLGLGKPAVAEIRSAGGDIEHINEQQRLILRESLAWPVDVWLSLSPERRQFLFSRARREWADDQSADGLSLAIIDGLVANKLGGEVELWIGALDAGARPALREQVIGGSRGLALLGLDRPTAFRERGVVALHRGITFMGAGDLREALSSFALAMRYGGESREASAVLGLSRRWLSYVLAQFRTDTDVLALLTSLVPREDFRAIVDELIWRAALVGDADSFALLQRHVRPSSAAGERARRLEPLARGQGRAFIAGVRDGLGSETQTTLRLLRQLMEHIEAEDAEVRAAQGPVIRALVDVVSERATLLGDRGAGVRAAQTVLERMHATLDGLAEVSDGSDVRSLSPNTDRFAGSVRLAPTDTPPWPFTTPQPGMPSVFTPIVLEPLTWRDEVGALVYGFRMRE